MLKTIRRFTTLIETKASKPIPKLPGYLQESVMPTGTNAIFSNQTPIVHIEKTAYNELSKFDDLLNIRWKNPTVQSWINSFQSGKSIGLVELDKEVFGTSIREDIMARCLKYEQSWAEAGTESTKTLGQVRGSSQKPFPQKGRGKARVGTLRAPHFKGGYNSHGPRPHRKMTDIQRNVYESGIRSALSTKFQQNQLILVDRLLMTEVSKPTLKKYLKGLGLEGKKVYLMYGAHEASLALVRTADTFVKRIPSVRIPAGEKPVLITPARHVAVKSLLEYDYLIVDKEAVEVPNLKNKVTEVFSILKAAEKEIKSESKADKKEE
ncbi:hypothetical protein HDV02_003583 [Globomyces sp. JEL0801]|nr:hypothetical protein HDV02_003583 [Globomyces sp. JEL0801]